MNNTMRTNFEASLFNLPQMKVDAEQIASDMGFHKRGDVDAFRHAYTSAKMKEAYGNTVANVGGHANEVTRDIYTRVVTLGERGNPTKEWDMDIYNNEVGRNIETQISQQGSTGIEKERKLREEVAAAVRDGRLQTDPNVPSQTQRNGTFTNGREVIPPVGSSGDINPTTVPQSSILDSLNRGLGQVGSAISTAGHVAFDAAMGLGKETLNQTIRLALSHGVNGKGLMKQATQMAVGNMLAGMHAQVMGKVMRDPRMPTGIVADPFEDMVPRGPVESVMNDPRNQGVFERIASEVQRILMQFGDLDPAVIMADQGLKHIRKGEMKIPQGIVLPDIFAPDHRPKPEDIRDMGTIDIFGIRLPIGLPPIGTFDGKIDENPWEDRGLKVSRGGDGMVEVRSYSRGGSSVAAHTRSRPDGEVGNNLSYRATHGVGNSQIAASGIREPTEEEKKRQPKETHVLY